MHPLGKKLHQTGSKPEAPFLGNNQTYHPSPRHMRPFQLETSVRNNPSALVLLAFEHPFLGLFHLLIYC